LNRLRLRQAWGLLLWMGCALAMPLAARAETPTILVLGDSLSAGYGLDIDDGWVALLQARLDAQGYDWQVVNASISGDTTAGGVSRLPAAMDRAKPQLVLIELGGNDGLRGQPIAAMRANLASMVDTAKSQGATPVLFEMRIPANYGPAYTRQFTEAFASVAQADDVPLVPFFLGAFAEDPDQFQADGIHPDASAQPAMLDAVWPVIEPLLEAANE